MSVWAWLVLEIGAALYCLARGITDARRGSAGWALAGIASAAVILLTPNPNNKVSITIPIAAAAGGAR